ncbi:G-X-X-X-Q-X-W domain-containing protein [Coprinopsis sp. MPI-PUGE-AT-0042]|nr:G-X-X-X-Q-X-W domain-containing protein [Coprinopsis sp. MPI-PUGE-AT-0042]
MRPFSVNLPLSLVYLATCKLLGVSAQTYTVLNNCPTSIDLHIGSTFDSTLTTGAQVVKTGLGPTPGHFWTPTNGGLRDGANVAAAAGFRMNPNEWFYYIVEEQNHNEFNTGISITPSVPATDGFCTIARCDQGGCPGAFDFGPSAPNYQGYEPPILPTDPARNPPFYQCKTPGVNFLITFCPSGQWPSPPGEVLRNNWNDKCLDVRGGVFQNGTPVQIYDCTTSPQQYWVYHRGIGQVRVKGTNFCLDSGSDPINGSQMKIWECYENLPAQTWFRTWDSRLVRAGTSLCLDLTNGSLANGNIIQTWTCSDLNRNQNWHKSGQCTASPTCARFSDAVGIGVSMKENCIGVRRWYPTTHPTA